MRDQRQEDSPSICPKSGKPLKFGARKRWVKWFFPITGLAAFLWFLVRVIPKPSRATYPCQRVAFPLASSFISYILGLSIVALAMRKARRRFHQSRYILAVICLIVGLIAAFFTISLHSRYAGAAFVPPDPPNTPMGVAKGIFPGRVVWVRDANATYWDPAWNSRKDIHYWDDSYTDANVVEEMMSKSLCWLTGEVTDKAAWDKLFRQFNKTHGNGDIWIHFRPKNSH